VVSAPSTVPSLYLSLWAVDGSPAKRGSGGSSPRKNGGLGVEPPSQELNAAARLPAVGCRADDAGMRL
jgi:hypothetical protein